MIHTAEDILIQESRDKVEIFQFAINHSQVNVCGPNVVTIRFKNYKFESCEFPFRGGYSREQWRVLGAIAEKIREIEKQYEAKEINS